MRPDVVVRWVARAWSVASGLVLFAFVFGGGESLRPTGQQTIGLLLFPVGVVAGFAIAWWREAIGGLVTVGSLALFYVWMFAHDGRLPPSPYFLLLAAPGFLFLASAVVRGRRGRSGFPGV